MPKVNYFEAEMIETFRKIKRSREENKKKSPVKTSYVIERNIKRAWA